MSIIIALLYFTLTCRKESGSGLPGARTELRGHAHADDHGIQLAAVPSKSPHEQLPEVVLALHTMSRMRACVYGATRDHERPQYGVFASDKQTQPSFFRMQV